MDYFEWGFRVVVVGMLAWTIREVWYDHKKRIECKVDRDFCKVKHETIDEKLDRIQNRVDAIYDRLINGRR